jgi:hypothetical protein
LKYTYGVRVDKGYIMTDYENGMCDATNDLADGWVPEKYTLEYVINQLRIMMDATDSYIAGYCSVLFK